jgi:hypothetical protein
MPYLLQLCCLEVQAAWDVTVCHLGQVPDVGFVLRAKEPKKKKYLFLSSLNPKTNELRSIETSGNTQRHSVTSQTMRESSACYISARSQNFVKQLISTSCLSVRIEQVGCYWTSSHEIRYFSIFRKPVEKIKALLKSDKNDGYFTWRPVYIIDTCFNLTYYRAFSHTICASIINQQMHDSFICLFLFPYLLHVSMSIHSQGALLHSLLSYT